MNLKIIEKNYKDTNITILQDDFGYYAKNEFNKIVETDAKLEDLQKKIDVYCNDDLEKFEK